jgi:hypothetical protein
MSGMLLLHGAASREEYSASGGGEGLRRALSSSPEQVIEEVGASGLRGRGGGGFPTGEKWDAIRGYGTGMAAWSATRPRASRPSEDRTFFRVMHPAAGW